MKLSLLVSVVGSLLGVTVCSASEGSHVGPTGKKSIGDEIKFRLRGAGGLLDGEEDEEHHHEKGHRTLLSQCTGETVELSDGNFSVDFCNEIITPADTVLYTGAGTLTVPFGGIVEIGQAPPPPLGVVYVMDISGSTGGGSRDVCAGDENGDGSNDTVLDCEILTLAQLNNDAIDSGIVSETRLVRFDDVAMLVPSSGAISPNQDLWTPPTTGGYNTDLSSAGWSNESNGVPDIEDLLRRSDTNFGATTDSQAAVQKACMAINEFPPGLDVAVIFISDGTSNQDGNDLSGFAECLHRGPFLTVAAGSSSSCAGGILSLNDISDASNGGFCTEVLTLSELPPVTRSLLQKIPKIRDITVSVEPTPNDISNLTVTQELPICGPGSVEYSGELMVDLTSDVLPTEYTICVNATGTSKDEEGSIEVCKVITFLLDSDGDGVPDINDECPFTAPNEVVRPKDGCSIADRCPCNTKIGHVGSYHRYPGHVPYIICVQRIADLYDWVGLISYSQNRAIVREAIRSGCGRNY